MARQDSPYLTGEWREAYDLWMAGLRSDGTRRAYALAWCFFLDFVEKTPDQVGRSDVARWVDAMRKRGLSACTRQQRLAAISSFFAFVAEDFTKVVDGQEVALHSANPAAGRRFREHINPYGKAIHLGVTEVRQLLDAVRRKTTPIAQRDYALYLAYLLTGRRNTEIRQLRWGDLEQSGGRVWYRWSGKGKHDQRYEMPLPVWQAIRAALAAAGRLESIQPGDYIFTALRCRRATPISMREVGRRLKLYCVQAGLNAGAIHVHTLRHSAAMLRKLAGDDLEVICHFLGHSNVGVTQIYMHSIEGNRDESWSKAADLLGLENGEAPG
jgi:site-specific recombinase XerD